MKQMIANVDPAELANAKTLKDSVNLTFSKNIYKKVLQLVDSQAADDFHVNIDDTMLVAIGIPGLPQPLVGFIKQIF